MTNESLRKAYTSILLIKPGAIGDLLHLTPVLRTLKRLWPEARVTVLVNSPVTASLFTHNPQVDETVIFDRKGEHRSWGALFALWRRLRERRFDLVVNFQRSNLKGWFLASAAFPCRVLVYHKARNRQLHAVTNHLEALLPLGIDPAAEDHRLDFFPGSEDDAFAARFWAEHELEGVPVVAFNPGTAQAVKCWPAERFAALGDRIASEMRARVLLVGSHAERELTAQVAARMTASSLDLAGCTLGQLGAVLKRSALLVTGDTGPMHLACAVGTPVVALYGPISPTRSGPIGVPYRLVVHDELSCVPCNAFACKHEVYRECMELITTDEVFTAVAESLATGEGRRR